MKKLLVGLLVLSSISAMASYDCKVSSTKGGKFFKTIKKYNINNLENSEIKIANLEVLKRRTKSGFRDLYLLNGSIKCEAQRCELQGNVSRVQQEVHGFIFNSYSYAGSGVHGGNNFEIVGHESWTLTAYNKKSKIKVACK